MGHLWDLSPPFFILIGDLKEGIVQSSVKKLAATFRRSVLQMDIFLCFSFVRLVSEFRIYWKKISRISQKK